MENKKSIGAGQQRVAGTLRMRHETKDITLLVANPRNIVLGSVRVGGLGGAPPRITITKQHLTFELETMKHGVLRKVATLSVSDGKPENGAGPRGCGERIIVALDPHVNVLADEMQPTVSNERSRKQTAFAKNLKAITDAQDNSPLGGEAHYRAHNR